MRNISVKANNIRVAVCLLIFLCIFAAAPITAYSEQASLKETTVMIYMCGSDLESVYSSASKDVQEIISSGFDSTSCNVLIMAGGSKNWKNPELHSDGAAIFRVAKKVHDNSVSLRKTSVFDNMNMGEASSLEAFLSYCYEEYPARNYALILWDHGGGPMEGVCFDDTQNRDSLSLSELASALASTTPEHGLAWIGIDACLMASFETASICSPYADYLIASQDTEPASGWNYSFLKELSGELPGDHIPHLIVDSYISQNNSLMLTLSCIDLSQIDIISQAMDKMFNALEQQLTVNSFSQLSNERRDSKSFGRATTLSDYDLVDLYHLAQQYEQAVPDESAALQSAIKAAVYSSSNQKDVNGVSLYSPYYNKNSFTEKWHSTYKSLDISQPYLKYIDQYSKIWLGGQLGDWSKLDYHAQPVSEDRDSQLVELEMTEDQLAHFSSAKVLILQSAGEGGTYKKVFESEMIQPVGNRLEYEYGFFMLYALNRSGKPVTGALAFETVDGYYVLTPVLKTTTNFSAWGATLDALKDDYVGLWQPQLAYSSLLRGHRSETGDALIIDSYSIANPISSAETSDDSLFLTRELESLDTTDFQYLDFEKQNIYRVFEKDSEGKALPYNDWPKASYSEQMPSYIGADGNTVRFSDPSDILRLPLDGSVREFGTVDLREPWSLEFVKSNESERAGLYAQFIITDTQGNQIASELIPLNRDNIEGTGIMRETIYSDTDKGYSFSFDSLEALRTRDGTELRFTFTGTFPSQENCMLPAITTLELDGISAPAFSFSDNCMQYDAADGEKVIRKYILTLSPSELPVLDDLFIHQLRLAGNIYSMITQPNRDSRSLGRVEKEYEFDITFAVDLDLSCVWNLYGQAERDEISYQLFDLKLNDYQSLTGSLRLKNTSDQQTHTLIFEKEEGLLPGVCINDYYIDDAWSGADTVMLLPNEERTIAFEIRFPVPALDENGASFFEKWDIRRLETLTLSIWDKDVRYSFYNAATNKYIIGSPDYEKISISLNPAVALPDRAENSPKAIMLGEQMSVLIGSVSRYDGLLCMDIMIQNGYPYYLMKDMIMNDRENTILDFTLMDCQVDYSDCVMRIKPVASGQDQLAWDDHLYLDGNQPHTYRSYQIEIARADGTDISAEFHELGLRITYTDPGTNRYVPTSYCFIHIPDNVSSPVLSSGNLVITPAVLSAKIHFSLPDNPEQYSYRLAANLPEQIVERFDKDEVSSTSAFILSQPIEEDGECIIHRVYSVIPEEEINYNQGRLVILWLGILVWPEGGESPFITNIRLDDHLMTTDLGSFSINGFALNGQRVDYLYTQMQLKSDLRDAVTELTSAMGSNSFTDSTRAQSIEYQSMLLTVRQLPDGLAELLDCQTAYVNCEYRDNNVQFSFLPAAERSPLILYCFKFKDGSIASLIVPFENARDASYNVRWTCMCCGSETYGRTCASCGHLKSSWICADCGKVNTFFKGSVCAKCGLPRSDSFTKTAKAHLNNNDYSQAIPYLKATLNNGSSYSSEWLGYLYSNGYGVEKDLDLALEYARVGTTLNSSYCYKTIGNILLEKAEPREALWNYLLAAYLGDADAYLKIGDLYRNPANGMQDNAAALEAYKAAAAKGNTTAIEWCDYYEGTGAEKAIEDDGNVIVVRDGNHYTIQTANFQISFVLPEDFICFTTDKEASTEVYAEYTDFYDIMIKNGWFLYVYNPETRHRLQFTIKGGDFITEQIHDFSKLREDQQFSYASCYAQVNSIKIDEILRCEGNDWLRCNSNVMTTIAGGKLISANWLSPAFESRETDEVNREEIAMLLQTIRLSEPESK